MHRPVIGGPANMAAPFWTRSHNCNSACSGTIRTAWPSNASLRCWTMLRRQLTPAFAMCSALLRYEPMWS